ncbi:MAG: hypothetical protein IJ302_07125 [Clostridia bacterium]|nr:hypothetical protein [Clostridia bacterium]
MNTINANSHTHPLPAAADAGKTAVLCGRIYKIRRMSGFAFLILQTGQTLLQCIWSPGTAPAIPEMCIHSLREQSTVRITGTVVPDDRARCGFELHLHTLEVLSTPADTLPVVINGRKPLPLETDLLYRPLTLRREETRAVFAVMAALSEGCANFFSENGFCQIHTPKICCGTAESGAGVFSTLGVAVGRISSTPRSSVIR